MQVEHVALNFCQYVVRTLGEITFECNKRLPDQNT